MTYHTHTHTHTRRVFRELNSHSNVLEDSRDSMPCRLIKSYRHCPPEIPQAIAWNRTRAVTIYFWNYILNYDNQIKRRPKAVKVNVVQREPETNSTQPTCSVVFYWSYALWRENFPLTEYQHTNELLKPTELRAFVIRKHEGAFFNFFLWKVNSNNSIRAQLNCTFSHTNLNVIIFIRSDLLLFIKWHTIVSNENERPK
jgi:hypothetical protein